MNGIKLVKHGALSVREMAFCGLFTALIATGAFIQINIPVQPFPMHFTLQFFFVLLAGFLLGPRLGTLSVCIYLAAHIRIPPGICLCLLCDGQYCQAFPADNRKMVSVFRFLGHDRHVFVRNVLFLFYQQFCHPYACNLEAGVYQLFPADRGR